MVRTAILIIFFFIQALLLLSGSRWSELTDAFEAESRSASIHELSAAVNNYYLETGDYPATLADLFAAPGYEYLQSVTRPDQRLVVANNLNDGTFRYSRAVVYSQDPYKPALTDANFLAAANNACGTGTFATGAEWCGPDNGTAQWWKHETREEIAEELAREKRRLQRLLQKFNAWYNDDVSVSTEPGVWGNNYPNPGAAAARLHTLVAGFAQTATTCSGIYTFARMPIDCTDLFSIWGTPTVYNYISPTHIVLITQTPFLKADGTSLYISTEESL